MNNYLTEKRMFSDKILDLVTSLQHIEEQMDDMYESAKKMEDAASNFKSPILLGGFLNSIYP